MAALPQFDYIFAIGMLFAFLDAWNIGANDVANSFATSVSSRSLTMVQAMFIATICEFVGAVLAGARVSSTIKNGIIKVEAFEDNPSVLMLGMACALIGSSLWLTLATKLGAPVSTTHSIVGGIIGVGVAALGADGVAWGWDGVSEVFAAWGIAPGIAGGFAIIIFMISKYGVLERKDPVKAGLWMIPFYFAITAGVCTMVIVWKGAASLDLDDWTAGQILGCIFGVSGGVVLVYAVFLLPFLYRRVALDDWTIKNWEVIKGPFLWFRGEVPPAPEGHQVVQDYYHGHHNPHDGPPPLESRPDVENTENTTSEKGVLPAENAVPASASTPSSNSDSVDEKLPPHVIAKLKAFEEPLWSVRGFYRRAKYFFFRGVNRDVVSEQLGDGGEPAGFLGKYLAGNLKQIHGHTAHYNNKAEHLYSFLQVMTAAVASFAHGANDVSNAVGPLSAIYHVWQHNETGSKSPVPIWVLAYGGAAIAIGLWTYGYNLMRNLGNRLTLHSPSRGFSMELGAAVTVVLATRLSLPVSTTQCITGATVGVGLCSGAWRAINWRMIAWIYLGWIITLPCAGLISGCLMGIILNAPSWGLIPQAAV